MLHRGDGPFQVLGCINDNAYKPYFPGEYNVSATFNVTELSPFDVGDDLRTNPFQDKGKDGGMAREWSTDMLEIPLCPMTRARAKRFKEALNVFEEAHVFNPKDETKMVHVIKVNSDLYQELGHFLLGLCC